MCEAKARPTAKNQHGVNREALVEPRSNAEAARLLALIEDGKSTLNSDLVLLRRRLTPEDDSPAAEVALRMEVCPNPSSYLDLFDDYEDVV